MLDEVAAECIQAFVEPGMHADLDRSGKFGLGVVGEEHRSRIHGQLRADVLEGSWVGLGMTDVGGAEDSLNP